MKPGASSVTTANLKVEQSDEMTRVEFCSRANTLDWDLMTQLSDLLGKGATEWSSGIVLLTGRGSRFFSPGFDLQEVRHLDRTGMRVFMKRFLQVCRSLYLFPLPVCAFLNGDALGGGFLLAACCRLRIGRAGIRCGFTEFSREVEIPIQTRRLLESQLGREGFERLFESDPVPAEHLMTENWVSELVESDSEVTGKLLRRFLPELEGDFDPALFEGDDAVEDFLDRWFGSDVQTALNEVLRRLHPS